MQWLWCDCHTVTLLSRKAPLHISCHWPRSLTLSPGPHYGQHQALHYQPPGHSGPWEQQHYQYKVEEKAIFVNIHKIKLIEEGQVHQEAAVGSPRFSTSQAPPPPRPWQQAPCATRPRTLRPPPAPGEGEDCISWGPPPLFLSTNLNINVEQYRTGRGPLFWTLPKGNIRCISDCSCPCHHSDAD